MRSETVFAHPLVLAGANQPRRPGFRHHAWETSLDRRYEKLAVESWTVSVELPERR